MKSYLAAAFIMLSAAPVFAQNCISSLDQLEGEYEITNGPGQLINVPNIGILPALGVGKLTARFTKYGDAIGLDSEVFGSMVVDFVEVTDPSEMWNFRESDVFTSASSEDIADVTNCGSSNQLIRLLGTGVTELPDVGTRQVTMRLTVFNNNFILGRMDVVMVPPNITLQTRISMSR